jgi:integrase
LTPERGMKKTRRRPSVICYGKEAAEIRIYTLRRKADGYTSYQCAWYELGRRATKVFAELPAAKTFAQQKTIELTNGRTTPVEAGFREIEILRACEARVAKFGLTLSAAIEEWTAARRLLGGCSLVDAARTYADTHAGIKPITVSEAADLFIASREASGVSQTYVKGLRCYFRSLKEQIGPCLVADVTTQQLDRVLQSISVGVVTKNNVRRTLVTLFKWARDQGYLQADRKTAAEKTMTFNEPGDAPAIFTPDELKRIIAVCPENLLPHIVIGAFAGIRSAEIARLEWADVLWEQGYIEIKARKAKTKARRLVPLLPNLRAWLEPYRGRTGLVCHLPNTPVRLNYLGEKAGFGWRQNALRHSYASYRLAQVQDAAKVALEMGNSPEKLFRHYRELVTASAAAEWFRSYPKTSPFCLIGSNKSAC